MHIYVYIYIERLGQGSRKGWVTSAVLARLLFVVNRPPFLFVPGLSTRPKAFHRTRQLVTGDEKPACLIYVVIRWIHHEATSGPADVPG